MIRDNRTLLDADGLFDPALNWIEQSRVEVAEELDEEFKDQCRNLLTEHGVTDRQSLIRFGSVRLSRGDFPPYGKGKAFVVAIFGETFSNFKPEYLHLIADKLQLPQLSDQSKDQCIQVLASQGITDRKSLMRFGSVKFAKEDFPPYGKGRALARAILGDTFDRLNLEQLGLIADILFGEQSEESKKQEYLQALTQHGITDRASLYYFGVVNFVSKSFPPFGKGNAFASAILGKSQGSVTAEVLDDISDAIGLPQLDDDSQKQKYIQALTEHGITDRTSLYYFGVHKFRGTDFPPFGKGDAFASLILSERVRSTNMKQLNRIADLLDLPKDDEEMQRQRYVKLLAEKGISDRKSLIDYKAYHFVRTDFPPFGKGKALAAIILGEKFPDLKISHLNRIADILYPEETNPTNE